jgi:hypothetical protein
MCYETAFLHSSWAEQASLLPLKIAVESSEEALTPDIKREGLHRSTENGGGGCVKTGGWGWTDPSESERKTRSYWIIMMFCVYSVENNEVLLEKGI